MLLFQFMIETLENLNLPLVTSGMIGSNQLPGEWKRNALFLTAITVVAQLVADSILPGHYGIH